MVKIKLGKDIRQTSAISQHGSPLEEKSILWSIRLEIQATHQMKGLAEESNRKTELSSPG